MNRWKFRRNTSRLILFLASLLTLIVIVMTGVSGYAIDPDGAYIGQIKGTGLVIGMGDNRRKSASRWQELRPNTILYVPGNRSWANLGFFEDSPKDHTGLLVQAGPSEMISEWSFPCSAKGRLTINWKEGKKRGCEEGVKLQSSSKRGWLPNNNLQASRRLLAQAEDEVTVVPTPGQSIIQTADSAAGISIDVLVGDVRVKSARNPGGRLVKAGERYDYPQDTITPIDINPIVNSPETQDFLNPNNWSSPDIPQRIANGFSEQLGEMRTALGNGSPAVASNSGNNNNSRQSPLNQSPQRTVPQSTQPQPTTPEATQPQQPVVSSPTTPASQPSTASDPGTNTNLSGQWVFNFGWFTFDAGNVIGTCKTAPAKGAYQVMITIDHYSENYLIIFVPPGAQPRDIKIGNGQIIATEVPQLNTTVSGNQFEAEHPVLKWRGTISSDGNKITGTGTCGSASLSFTMIRQSSQ